MITINEGNYGEKLYKIGIGTGTAFVYELGVYAYNETEAVDLVADYLEEKEYNGLYGDYYDIADECGVGQDVEEYIEEYGYICCGKHGIYMQIVYIEEVAQ